MLATGCLQLMGHRDPRSVEKYAKLDIRAIRAGLERLHRRGRGRDLAPNGRGFDSRRLHH